MFAENTEQAAAVVLALDDSAATLERVGGKGASLARMAAGGLPVPPGFHITTSAYRRFVDASGLQKIILAAVIAAEADVAASLELAAARIQTLFTGARMPEDMAGAVRQAYLALGGDLPVAVRSSATAEDLPGLSFAGQQETYRNIRGADAWGLGEAVVGGLVTPDALTVDKESGKVVDEQINIKEVMTVRSGGGTDEEPVPPELRTKPVLSPQSAPN